MNWLKVDDYKYELSNIVNNASSKEAEIFAKVLIDILDDLEYDV